MITRSHANSALSIRITALRGLLVVSFVLSWGSFQKALIAVMIRAYKILKPQKLCHIRNLVPLGNLHATLLLRHKYRSWGFHIWWNPTVRNSLFCIMVSRVFAAKSSPQLIMQHCFVVLWVLNTLRPRQNGRHFADEVFKCIFLNENVWTSHNISLNFAPKFRINNILALVQIIAWRRSGDKPLSEPMMISLLTHISVTRYQEVKDKTHRILKNQNSCIYLLRKMI